MGGRISEGDDRTMPIENFEDRAERVVNAVFGAKHQWPTIKKHTRPEHWEINCSSGLATFDNDRLTRLVLAAHKEMVRAEITPCNFQYLKIKLHRRRNRIGAFHERHPSIEVAIRTFYKENQ
jgi:hypothetical protein